MSKKKSRPLSTRVREELKDTETYMHKLSPKDRQWLQDNYIDPELKQRFTSSTPQAEKRRVWRQSKLELRCVDGCPGWLQYDSSLLEPTPSEDPQQHRLSANDFLATIEK